VSSPDFSDIKLYLRILLPIGLHAFVVMARLACFSFHRDFLGRTIIGAANEFFRLGSDLSLIAIGVAVGAFSNQASYFYQVTKDTDSPYITGLAFFFIIYALNYFLYLFLLGRFPNEVFRKPSLAIGFITSMVIGLLSLGLAAALTAPIK